MMSIRFFGILAALLGVMPARAQDVSTNVALPQIVTITRLYSGSDGESHLDTITLPSVGGVAGRSIGTRLYATDLEMGYTVPGTFINWHGVSTPRLLIILAGVMEIGLGDGSKHLLKAGDAVLAMDMTGHGHTSRVVGDVPSLALTVRLPKDDPLKLKLSPCTDNVPAADCVATKATVTGPNQ